MAFAVFQLAEYSAMILCSTMVSLVFLGGWLSPVAFPPDSAFWLFAQRFLPSYFSSGYVQRFLAILTTKSCVWAGRFSYRCVSSGCWLSAAG